jgi:predicted cobalt transporter CbtA
MNIKMKKWLKYGLIFGIVSLILEVIDYVLAIILCPEITGGIGCILPIKIVESIVPDFVKFGNFIINILMTIIFYFIIGAIIGLIVNKIRDKK